MSQPEFITLTDEQVKARKRRNIAIALGLVLFIVTVYVITVSRLHSNNEARQAQEAAAASQVASPAVVPTEPAAAE